MVSKLALDVKALTLLYGSDDGLRGVLSADFIESRDEDMRRFVRALQTNREPQTRGAIFVALAEIVLASFLAIMGIVAFVPNLLGLNTPLSMREYFSGLVSASLVPGPLSSAVVALEFVFAAIMMLGSFYTLRQASSSVKRAGTAPNE